MQGEIEDSRSSLSFSCYSTETLTSTAIAKVIHEEHLPQFHKNEDVEEDEDFEFKLFLKEINSPSYNREFPYEVVDIEIESKHHESYTLDKLLNNQHEDELERLPSGTFCVWSPTNSKKSSSTGFGSKGWIIRYLLRLSNSEGKESMMLLSSKQKRSSSEVLNIAGRWKAGTPVHERFYVQRRAENEVGKRKSYLPYRKDLIGLSFASVIGMANCFPFDMIKP